MSVWDSKVKDADEYLKFMKWCSNDKESWLDVKIVGKEPIPFVNKWGREQLKIKCHPLIVNKKDKTTRETGEEKFLTGGPKLFSVLKMFVPKNKINLHIVRKGIGFMTTYEITELDNGIQTTLDSV